MQATLGLTGLTMNAMALIAPGAFLWLTFFIQATAGNTPPAMRIYFVRSSKAKGRLTLTPRPAKA